MISKYSDGVIAKIYIRFDEFSTEIIQRDSDSFAKLNGVDALGRIELDTMMSKSSAIVVKCTQFSIMLARACITHKTQT